jgi:hypothetical protein
MHNASRIQHAVRRSAIAHVERNWLVDPIDTTAEVIFAPPLCGQFVSCHLAGVIGRE